MQRFFNKLLKKQNKAAAQSETLKAHPTNTLLHILSVICLQRALQFYGNFLSSLTEHLFPILPKPENKKLVPQAESWQSWKDHHLHRHQRGFHHAALAAENNYTPVTHPKESNRLHLWATESPTQWESVATNPGFFGASKKINIWVIVLLQLVAEK